MRQFFIYIIVLMLIVSGFAYAADSHGGTESHTPANTEHVSLIDSSPHDDEHHAHHGCHLSVHLIGLTNEPASFKSLNARNSFSYSSKIYLSRLSVPPTKPPRC